MKIQFVHVEVIVKGRRLLSLKKGDFVEILVPVVRELQYRPKPWRGKIVTVLGDDRFRVRPSYFSWTIDVDIEKIKLI
jgi:hypothetical protein